MVDKGILTISLDFEMYWGLRDKRSVADYEANLRGVEGAITRILKLFEKYEIHATWATVGLLFGRDVDDLKSSFPRYKPSYSNRKLDPYEYITSSDKLDSFCHFAPDMIDLIMTYKSQEIGTHTFSHYYCLEKGQTIEQFGSDLQAALDIAQEKNISIKSLVFPRNQWNRKYLPALSARGITSFRGNERSWFYKASNGTEETQTKRAFRLLDSYFNLTGPNSYELGTIDSVQPYNIPSSRFLRPANDASSFLHWLRRRRIVNSIKQAAKNKEVFHLWWHPHNFGTNIDGNIKLLDSVLSCFSQMKNRYGMQSLNMGEISKIISDRGGV